AGGRPERRRARGPAPAAAAAAPGGAEPRRGAALAGARRARARAGAERARPPGGRSPRPAGAGSRRSSGICLLLSTFRVNMLSGVADRLLSHGTAHFLPLDLPALPVDA